MVEALELTSPCSVNEFMELKEYFEGGNEFSMDIMDSEDEAKSSYLLEKFVCITDSLGFVKYSNVKELKKRNNILLNLQIASNQIHEVLEKITQQQNQPQTPPETATLLNGLICFVSLNFTRIPTLLKLQNYNQLLIWSFKKASIKESNDIGAFIVNDTWYKFTKFKTVLAVDSSGELINYPRELFKYLIGEKLNNLDEIIKMPSELKEILAASSLNRDHEIDHYQKFSVSSLDLFVDNFPFPIYSSKTKLLKTEMTVEIDLYESINSVIYGQIFPLQLKYTESECAALEIEPNSLGISNAFPEFAGFRVFRKLSESPNSTIYEAAKLFHANEIVIIKEIRGDKRSELKFFEFFCSDQVQCEFIEKPLKIDANSKHPAIYMNYLQNRCDLFEFIYKRDFLLTEIIKKIFLQIVKAVDFLHSHGIIHRDIKDENVLIEQDTLNIKLIDFGSSAFLNDFEIDFKQYVGTFSYAPVEVLKGNPFNGPEQDIWCLGILLYVLCFKEPPFHSAKEILQGNLRLPVERPVEVIELIRQMIDPKPKNRPNTKMILNSKFLQ